MTLQEAIEELQSLNQQCQTSNYLSHYTIEQKLEKLLTDIPPTGNPELFEQFHALKLMLEAKIKERKKSNEKMIQELNFEETCKELIDANDIDNLVGLINIGEYFGTGSKHEDVCRALDEVYYFFRINHQRRKDSNKPCLDKLCTILKKPKLSTPDYNFQLFSDPSKKVQAILKVDDVNQLMVWLLGAEQALRNFALRCAAADDICPQSLMFLLQRTSPENTQYSPINLLTPGKPSGRIALHTAVKSVLTINVSMLLNEEFNPSNDLLRQLLVGDKDGLTPITLIEKVIEDGGDIIDCSRIVRRIKEALDKYQNNPRLSLSEQEIQSVNQSLQQVESKISSTQTVMVFEGLSHTTTIRI